MPTPLRSVTSVREFFDYSCAHQTAISVHLPTIRHYAAKCEMACEFGVKYGASSSALLMGAHQVHSWDIKATPEAEHLRSIAGPRWEYTIADSRAGIFGHCDLLFIDSLHTYAQVRSELEGTKGHVSKYLIFHDTITFGSVGADGETGRQSWNYADHRGESVPDEHLGIVPVIFEFMSQNREWQVEMHDARSHGLLVLRNSR